MGVSEVEKQGRDDNTRRLHYYSGFTAKKGRRLHLLRDYATGVE